jgi:hypothetical protein
LLGFAARRVYFDGWLRLSVEGKTNAESVFAAAYLVCAVIALRASRMRTDPSLAAMAPFWLRIAFVCVVFAFLRYFNAHLLVSGLFHSLGQGHGVSFWRRPGSYAMMAAIAASGVALLGLFFFRPSALHRSVRLAATAIVLLILLVVAQSVSLYWTGVYLEASIGPVTVSRIIEALLVALIALSGLWFTNGARADRALRV